RTLARRPVRRRPRPLRRHNRPARFANGPQLCAGGLFRGSRAPAPGPWRAAAMIRIANGQGFWGDWLEAPVRLVEQGPIDYLALDYLAEVTMSILQKQKQADPNLGYARDFPPLIARIAKPMRDRGITVIANAGGVNPVACAREVVRLAPGLKVAVVLGDDVYPRLDTFLAKGYEMRDMDTGEPIAGIRDRIQSAN